MLYGHHLLCGEALFLTEDWFPQYRHFYATPHASYFYYSLQRREGSEDQNNMTSFRQTNPKCLLQLSTNWTFEPVTPHAYVHQVHLWGFDCSAALFAGSCCFVFKSCFFFFPYIYIQELFYVSDNGFLAYQQQAHTYRRKKGRDRDRHGARDRESDGTLQNPTGSRSRRG